MAADSRIPARSALEAAFPTGAVSTLSRYESWRKELHRPPTYIQKWWAQRLGTVTRAILCAAVSSHRANALRAYRSATRLSDLVVFDPFAGSGTSLVEAAKMGATVVGRDINPVATLCQRQAFQEWDLESLRDAFRRLGEACSSKINELYRTAQDEAVLYYFWAAVTECPTCGAEVELFSRHVFAQHAYPKEHPSARAICSHCHAIATLDLSTDKIIRCDSCGQSTPLDGPVSRAGVAQGHRMRCVNGHENTILNGARRQPLRRRMFAKLVVTSEGAREYRPIDDFDRALFSRAQRLLRRHRSTLVQPRGGLAPGNNTDQALRWGHTTWASFFNDRQLYCLGLIASGIRDLDTGTAEREALIALFSKTLEFNNLFTSYKGEGTGAVRSIFHNHTLKPERTPLEANPWGLGALSGSMDQLLHRLVRANEYKEAPRDLVPAANGNPTQVENLSLPLPRSIVESYDELRSRPGAAYISHGDSAALDLPDGSVDLVVTDPPHVGKVHYSELADFFHAWLRELKPFPNYPSRWKSTRREQEVQNISPQAFGKGLTRVWKEVCRVLRDDGLLIFSFHHADTEGWQEVMTGLREARLLVTSVQPVMAEMSTSVAKTGASSPCNLDALVVCRKAKVGVTWARSAREASSKAVQALQSLQTAGITFTSSDVMSVVGGSVLSLLTNPLLDTQPDGLRREAETKAADAFAALTPTGAKESP